MSDITLEDRMLYELRCLDEGGRQYEVVDDAFAEITRLEPDEEMLASTCDEKGRMRLLEFTRPEERSMPFLMPRFVYRAIIAFVRARNSGASNVG